MAEGTEHTRYTVSDKTGRTRTESKRP